MSEIEHYMERLSQERALADDLVDIVTIFAPVVELYLHSFGQDDTMTESESERFQEIEHTYDRVDALLARYIKERQ